jgi:predicted dehydrogenase/threonine dehydrogenase-like Zn-dependent dehydrogenase
VKQLLQDISSGELVVTEVPAPNRAPAALLVATRRSLISAGTERAVMDLGTKSLVGKARARPDLARKVVDSVREEGLKTAYEKVRRRLGEPNPLGYSSSGVVLEAPDDAPAGPGELVACAGAGYASHAEIVSVPRTLCARVPEGVSAEQAAYATVAAIALHGVRLCELQLGDVATVVGLGLVGQLTLELLRAAGCVALGLDPDESRVELARAAGAFATCEPGELEAEAARRTARRGADGVLVTAASRNAEPLATAIAVARERATVCIVGDVAIQSPRTPLFAKELRLVVSRSYGPGRYDPVYEEQGIDYPAGYVRWTEGRNLEEVLRLMAAGSLRPERLTTHRFGLDEAVRAYAVLGPSQPSLGIVLEYAGDDVAGPRTVRTGGGARRRPLGRRARPRIGIIGAGTFARTVLLPQLARSADIAAVVTATGPSGRATAERFGASVAGTDPALVLEADDIDAVVVATRHDTHAQYVVRALDAGKHVFVEKPLALDHDELAAVRAAATSAAGVLVVGFNRRYAPLATRMRDELGGAPALVHCRVNAGRLPRSHWTHDPLVGGGRIVGEVCHFVDLVTFLAGGTPAVRSAVAVEGSSEPREDTLAATLAFPDGSVATIGYAALGDPGMAKERVELLGERGAGVLDDFRELQISRGGRSEVHRRTRDKGHAAELAGFVEACRTDRAPQPIEELVAVMEATFDIRSHVHGTAG